MRIHVVAVVALASSCLSCSQPAPDDPRRAVVQTYSDIVLATYEDCIQSARALDAAVDALIANPSPQTLDVARARWQAARVPYGYSEAFRFYAGPIDDEDGPEGQLNGWPLDENHIDAVQSDAYAAAPGANIIGDAQRFPQITPELIAAQNEAGGEKNIASGYHAIEFLLWGQDLNEPPNAAGQRPASDFAPQADDPRDVNARRGQYLKAAVTLLIRDLESVANQWRPTQDAQPNYRRTLIEGDVPTALKRMFTGMAALGEVEMAGERMNVPLLSADQEEEQSCFSDTTADDLRANGAGIEHVYYGRYTRLDGTTIRGPSLADLVRQQDARIAQEMDVRLERTRAALAAIRNPFDREIHPDNEQGRARVQGAIDALRSQTQTMTRAARAITIFLSPLESDGD